MWISNGREFLIVGASPWLRDIPLEVVTVLANANHEALVQLMNDLTDLEDQVCEYLHELGAQAFLVDNVLFEEQPLPHSFQIQTTGLVSVEDLRERILRGLQGVPDRWKMDYVEYALSLVAPYVFAKPWQRWLRRGLGRRST